MKKEPPIGFPIFALALAAVILFEYGKAFDFYFVGDDFAFMELVLKEKARILWKPSVYYHYYPVGLLLNVLPVTFGVFEPRWFVSIGFIFFLASAVLAMMIYRRIAGSLLGGFLAALIYATAIPNSEVIYWKTGNQTIAMAFFSLLALFLFMRHLENRSSGAFLGCIAAYAMSMLCIEQGIVTFGILILYDLIFCSIPKMRAGDSDRRLIGISFLRRHAILLSVPVALSSLKLALGGQLSAFPISSRPWWPIPGVAVETAGRLIDFNNIISPMTASLSTWTLVVVFTLPFFLGYILVRRTAIGLFFLLASLGSILTISIAAGGPNLRYFCLPLVFYACFLSWFFNDAGGIISRMLRGGQKPSEKKMRASEWFRAAIHGCVCLAIAFMGLRGNLIRRDYWDIASTIERNMAQYVEDIYSARFVRDQSEWRIYLLNIPAFIVSEKHAVFYLASNSLMPDLRRRLGEAAERVELIATDSYFKMSIKGEGAIYRVLGRERIMQQKDIRKLVENGQLVLQFSPSTMTLAPWYEHR